MYQIQFRLNCTEHNEITELYYLKKREIVPILFTYTRIIKNFLKIFPENHQSNVVYNEDFWIHIPKYSATALELYEDGK